MWFKFFGKKYMKVTEPVLSQWCTIRKAIKHVLPNLDKWLDPALGGVFGNKRYVQILATQQCWHMKGAPLVGSFLVIFLRFETYGPFNIIHDKQWLIVF